MAKEEKEQASEGKRGQEKTISDGKLFSCNKNQGGGHYVYLNGCGCALTHDSYVFRLPLHLLYADYHWDCIISLSRSIHKGAVSYLVQLHLESALSLYNMISL